MVEVNRERKGGRSQIFMRCRIRKRRAILNVRETFKNIRYEPGLNAGGTDVGCVAVFVRSLRMAMASCT